VSAKLDSMVMTVTKAANISRSPVTLCMMTPQHPEDQPAA
jgi:hypothetical protein